MPRYLTIVIIATLATLALPAYQKLVARYQLKSVAEGFHRDLAWGRSLAIQNKTPVYVKIQTGANWCYGISDNDANCDCNAQNNCTVNGDERTVKAAEFDNAIGVTPVSPFTSNTSISFEGFRGTTNTAGQINFQHIASNLDVGVAVNELGRTTLCSTQLPGYDTLCN